MVTARSGPTLDATILLARGEGAETSVNPRHQREAAAVDQVLANDAQPRIAAKFPSVVQP